MDADQRELQAAAARCDRFLRAAPRRVHDYLRDLAGELAPDAEFDRYGTGEPLETLEHEVAELLGTEAAVFLLSGTIAQQAALRVHCDRRGRRVVAMHPTAHLELHERGAYARLHGLHSVLVGERTRVVTRADLDRVAEPVGALLLELPMREIGGVLPEWDDLAAQVEWARERGAAVHLDGARVWQCGPYYGRSLADIAGLFDTVYVSFYKDLLGIAGAALAGPADVVGEVRDWQARHGGLLYAQWPYAAAARVGLHRWLPRMPEFVAHARHLAELLGGRDDLVVTPDPPQVAMFHLALRVSPDDLRARALALADRTGLWTFAEGRPTDVPGWLRVEWSVTADTLKVGDDEVRRAFDELLGTA